MADAVISLLIETLGSMAFEKIKQEVGLITGLEDEVEKLMATLRDIQAVLVDAEKRQHRDAVVEIWLEKLKDVSLDIDDVLDEWLTPTALTSKMVETREGDEKAANPAKRKFSLLSLCICSGGGTIDEVRVRHRVAQEIVDLNTRLDEMARNKDKFKLERAEPFVSGSGAASRPFKITTSLLNEKEICGRDVEKEVLIRKLLPTSVGVNEHADRGFNIVSLVGIGGLGKTTLAQLAYNDERVKNLFDSRIWVCVSDPFDEIRIARVILKDLNCDTQDSDELNYLVQRIHGLVEKKRFLLVLDDVWNENHDKWEELEKALRNGAAGSMIVVTTRKEKVASTMGVAKRDMIVLESLSDEHCWQIFSQKAFFDRTEEECRQFEAIGRKIAEKSKGLPLLAKTLGGLMLSRKTISQWNNILKSELWELKDVQDIFAPFLLSYYDLLPSEKRCLLYCSIFPKDYEIEKDNLIRLWMSQGFFTCSLNLEEEGEACFESLSMRSFFQDFKIHKRGYDSSLSCKMHDVVCDFLKFLTKNEYCVVDNLIGPDDKKIILHERLRHLTIDQPGDTDIEGVLKYSDKKSKLRTLFVPRKRSAVEVLESSLFFQHTRIRTLKLGYGCSFPTNISKLIHLRYLDLSSASCDELPDEVCDLYNLQTLDLSRTEVKKLPENINKLTNLRYLIMYFCHQVTTLPDSICDLPKLQTLILSYCFGLHRLPEGLGKLVELKHLYFRNCMRLDGVPRGILSLTNLHKLKMDLRITKDAQSYLNVEDLKSINHLLQSQDSLRLYGCTNLLNAGEAQDIGIKRMELLTFLNISFKDNKISAEEQGIEDHEKQILEGLEPNQKLEMLWIGDYMGTTVSPKWMMSLVNLTHLYLASCPRCVVLPPLGKLPSLNFLHISSLTSLEKVSSEFLGFGNDDAEESCFTPFPKLETLSFKNLCKWESWTGTNAITTTVMPCLTDLIIEGCSRLKSLPDFLPLSRVHLNTDLPHLRPTQASSSVRT